MVRPTSLLLVTLLSIAFAAGANAQEGCSIVFVPDTQNRVPIGGVPNCGDSPNRDMLHADFQWIAAQKQGADPRMLPVSAVVSGGDLTSVGDDIFSQDVQRHCTGPQACIDFAGDCEGAVRYQWDVILGEWESLAQAGLCISLIDGDHDVVLGETGQDKAMDRMGTIVTTPEAGFDRYVDRVAGAWHETHASGCDEYLDDDDEPDFTTTGVYGTGLGINHAVKFDCGGTPVRIIGINVDAEPEEMDWVTAVLDAEPDVPTIVHSHAVVSKDGGRGGSQTNTAGARSPYGSAEWLARLDPYDEVFLALGGHYQSGPIQQYCDQDTGPFDCKKDRASGHTFHQFVFNFQSAPFGGRYLVQMDILPETNQLCWQTIAPTADWPGEEIDFFRPDVSGSDVSGCVALDWIVPLPKPVPAMGGAKSVGVALAVVAAVLALGSRRVLRGPPRG